MRILLMFFMLAACLSHPASGAEVIAPGMALETVKETLRRHAYEVDTRKYGMAIGPRDKNTSLEFCRIDDDITLVIEYDLSTEKVTSLDLYFYPENRTSKVQFVFREALEMQFEEDGVYTIKLRRKTDKKKTEK